MIVRDREPWAASQAFWEQPSSFKRILVQMHFTVAYKHKWPRSQSHCNKDVTRTKEENGTWVQESETWRCSASDLHPWWADADLHPWWGKQRGALGCRQSASTPRKVILSPLLLGKEGQLRETKSHSCSGQTGNGYTEQRHHLAYPRCHLRCCLSTWRREGEIPHHITDLECLTSSRPHCPQACCRSQIQLDRRFFPEQTTNVSTFVTSSKEYFKAVPVFTPQQTDRSLLLAPNSTCSWPKQTLRRRSRYVMDARDPVERAKIDFQGETILDNCCLSASADLWALISSLRNTSMLTTRVNGSHTAHSKITWHWSWPHRSWPWQCRSPAPAVRLNSYLFQLNHGISIIILKLA